LKKIIYIFVTLSIICLNNLAHAKLTGTIKVCTVHNYPYQEISVQEISASGFPDLEECDTILGIMLFEAFHNNTNSNPHAKRDEDGNTILEPHNPECFSSHIIIRL